MIWIITALFFFAAIFYLYKSIKMAYLTKRRVEVEEEPLEAIILPKPTRRIAGTVWQMFGSLAETSHKNKALFWDKECLDSTYFAFDILYEINKFNYLRGIKSFKDKNELLNYKKNVNKCFLEPRESESILELFYDKTLGAFRQHTSAPVTVVSTAEAFALLFRYTKNSNHGAHLETGNVREWIDKSTSFMKDCYDDQSGLFKVAPYQNEKAISTTFSSFLAMHDYYEADFNNAVKRWGHWPFDNFRITFESLKQHKRADDGNSETGKRSVAFSEKQGGSFENAFVCSTFYALNIGLCISELPSIYKIIDFDIKKIINRDEAIGILNFLSECFQDGGFSKRPGEASNIIHTRYGLQLLKHMLCLYEIIDVADVQNCLGGFRENDIIEFVNNSGAKGGFKLFPKDAFLPTIYATRLAVKSLNLLEEFRKMQWFEGDNEYQEQLGKFTELIDDKEIEGYLDRCSESPNRLYYGLSRF